MSGLVDRIRSGQCINDVAFRFIQNADSCGRKLHVFVEGPDDCAFYLSQVERCVADRVAVPYRCGGKRKVIETCRQLIDMGRIGVNTLFFVDRDLDWCSGSGVEVPPEVFVTNVYSYEHWLFELDTIRKFFRGHCGVEVSDYALDDVIRRFGRVYDDYLSFCRDIAVLMAYAKLASVQFDSDKLKFERLFLITDDLEIMLVDSAQPVWVAAVKNTGCNLDCNCDFVLGAILGLREVVSGFDSLSLVKGKFCVEMFASFLEKCEGFLDRVAVAERVATSKIRSLYNRKSISRILSRYCSVNFGVSEYISLRLSSEVNI